jgi:uncharacterized membrane protein
VKSLPLNKWDRALAWFGVANAVVDALRPRRSGLRRLSKWSTTRSLSRDALAVTAGVAAVALIGYAVRRHYLSRQLEEAPLRIKASTSIQIAPRALYDMLVNPERLISVLDFAESVTIADPGTFRWGIRQSSGEVVPVTIEIVDDAPGSLLAWRTTAESAFPHHGTVALQPVDQGRATLVEVELEDDSAGGEAGWEGSTESTIRKELTRLKQFLETGEVATTRGQPVGRRSVLGQALNSSLGDSEAR